MTDAPRVDLLPAIDLRRGRCVRLEQGLAERETVYDADPLSRARTFVAEGAEWIHVVDLDAAFGDGSNRKLIAQLATDSRARVQTGGGLRKLEDLEEVLDSEVARVVIGTAAIENPELAGEAVRRWGAERIVVGLDARGRTPAIRGWREDSDSDLFDLGLRLAELGVQTFLYTDISRDGMMEGPNLPMSIELSQHTGADVLVSGGVGSMQDINAIREAHKLHHGIVGVVVGKAIYEGKVGVRDALATLKGTDNAV